MLGRGRAIPGFSATAYGRRERESRLHELGRLNGRFAERCRTALLSCGGGR